MNYLLSLACSLPGDFPSDVPVQRESFDNWAKENPWINVCVAMPVSISQIIDLTNWAVRHNWTLRASGFSHNWAPYILPNENTLPYGPGPAMPFDGANFTSILIRTTRLNRMDIISTVPGDFQFWAETGISMEELLSRLENYGMGFLQYRPRVTSRLAEF